MKDYYAARAPEYDRVYLKPERQADLHEIRQWLPNRFEGRSVLEVACGTGYWTQYIAPVARHVLAVDAAVETMEIAQSRVEPGKVSFVAGDAYALPAAARAFESAFAGFWYSHIPISRVREFVTGLHRALKPGAKVVFLDNRYVPGSNHPVSQPDAEGNTYQVRKLDDGSTHRVLKNFPTQAELREAVAGLAGEFTLHEWEYYWALEYTVAAPEVRLTPAGVGDAQALVALRIAAMRESLERIGRFDPVRARERFLSGFVPEFTRHIEVSGRRVGFVVVKPQADHLLLDHLYIQPGEQGAGIGAVVMARVIAEAAAAGLPIRVGALKGSDSNRFYQRHGFRLVEQGEFDNYYLRP